MALSYDRRAAAGRHRACDPARIDSDVPQWRTRRPPGGAPARTPTGRGSDLKLDGAAGGPDSPAGGAAAAGLGSVPVPDSDSESDSGPLESDRPAATLTGRRQKATSLAVGWPQAASGQGRQALTS